MERSFAVSPFDGANRIRFKGSPIIANCRLPIEDCARCGRFNLKKRQIDNRQLAIVNGLGLSAGLAPPKRCLIFKSSQILNPTLTDAHSLECADLSALPTQHPIRP